jgi:hypothetical protein
LGTARTEPVPNLRGGQHQNRGGADMIGWFWRIFVGRFTSCRHKWVKSDEVKLLDDGKVVGYILVLSCGHCGDIKQVKI